VKHLSWPGERECIDQSRDEHLNRPVVTFPEPVTSTRNNRMVVSRWMLLTKSNDHLAQGSRYCGLYWNEMYSKTKDSEEKEEKRQLRYRRKGKESRRAARGSLHRRLLSDESDDDEINQTRHNIYKSMQSLRNFLWPACIR
jgi:hypothetical protein